MSEFQVFVSYSHEDQRWFDEASLVPWLSKSLKRDGVTIWYDRARISGGDVFLDAIRAAIQESRIAIILISQSFLNSDFIQEHELPLIMARAEVGEMHVVPILVGRSTLDAVPELCKRHMLPNNSEPLVRFIDSADAWDHAKYQILCSIRQTIRDLRGPAPKVVAIEEIATPSVKPAGAIEAPEPWMSDNRRDLELDRSLKTMLHRKLRQFVPQVGLSMWTPAYEIARASSRDIGLVAELESSYYGRDAVSEFILRNWHQSNPTGCFVIKQENRCVGHFNMLPIRRDRLSLLKSGRILESDIDDHSLYRPDELHLVTELYIESLIVDIPNKWRRSSALRCLLARFPHMVREMCDPANVTHVYAMAATAEGANLLTNLGFEIYTRAKTRLDHHDFYAVKYSDLLVRIGRFCD